LADALKLSLSNLFLQQGRASATKVLVIITSSQSSNTIQTQLQASLMRSFGVKIVGLFIGNGGSFGYSELSQIVTSSNEFNQLIVSSYSSLSTRITATAQVICVASVTSYAWAYNSTLDIVFALDVSNNIQSSDWSIIKSFLGQFVDGFQIASYITRFGFISYSDSASILYQLTQTQTSAAVKSAIANFQQFGVSSSSSRNLVAAIQLSLSGMFLRTTRSYASQVLIIISNGDSTDSTESTYISDFTQSLGIKIITLCICSTSSNAYTELGSVASYSSESSDLQTNSASTLISKLSSLEQYAVSPLQPTTVNVTYCYNSTVDIAFIIDDSSGVGSDNFLKIKQFISQVVDRFYVSATRARFAVVRYSDSPLIDFTFSQNVNNLALRNAISSLSYRGSSSSRNLAAAYNLAWTGLFQTQSSANAAKFGIVITNGPSDDASATLLSALLLRRNSVSQVGVYIGSSSDEGYIELVSIVSVTTDLASLYTTSFNGLNGKVNTLTNIACVPTVDCNPMADIVFLIDQSSSIRPAFWTVDMQFISNVVSQFNVGPNNFRIAAVKYSTTATLVFGLNQYSTTSQAANAFLSITQDGGSTNLAQAFVVASNNVFQPSARAGATQIIIIITDGRSDDSTNSIIQANLIKLTHMRVCECKNSLSLMKVSIRCEVERLQHRPTLILCERFE
jgi:hypothetical protein